MQQRTQPPLKDPMPGFTAPNTGTFPRSKFEGPQQGDPESQSLNNWQEPPQPSAGQPPPRKVYLRKVVQDAYEYHGLRDLAVFVLFAVVVSLVLYFHWSGTSAAFRTTVQQSFVNYGNDDYAQALLFSTDDMAEALQYIREYVGFHINRSDTLNLHPSGAVRIHDMADIYFARVLVNVDRSCEVSHLPCYLTSNESNPLENDARWGTQLNGQLNSRFSLNAGTAWKSLTIIWNQTSNQNPLGNNRTNFLERLSVLSNLDVSQFIGKYAYAVVVDLFATNVLKPRDSAIFTINIQRSLQPRARIATPLYKTTTTLPARRSFYRFKDDPNDAIRLGFECTFVLLFLYHSRKLFRTMAICWAQYKHINKWRWFTYVWNDYELLCMLSLLVWTVYYVVLVVLLEKVHLDWPPKSDLHMNKIVDISSNYSDWLWGYIGIMTANSLRLVRYMRVHSGLKAFYMVFVLAMNQFIDFAVFLIYIILLLGSAIFAFFQITGGNAQFLQFGDGLSVMSRLGFNLATYQEFHNGALGLGAATSSVTVLFWISVVLLFVYAQNIILAVVAQSYDQAKRMVGKAETSFPVLVFQRFVFTCVSIYHEMRTLRRRNDGSDDGPGGMGSIALSTVRTSDTLQRELSGPLPTLNPAGNGNGGGDDELRRLRGIGSRRQNSTPPQKALNFTRRSGTLIRHLMQMDQPPEPVPKPPPKATLWWEASKGHFARWALVRNQELMTLVALYHDFATLTLKRKPVWDLSPYLRPTTPVHPAHSADSVPPEHGSATDFPDLEVEVTEETLRSLLDVVHLLSQQYDYTPNPFQALDDPGLVGAITASIMDIYTKDKNEEVAKVIEKAQDLMAPQTIAATLGSALSIPLSFTAAANHEGGSRRPSNLTLGTLPLSPSMQRSAHMSMELPGGLPWSTSMRRTLGSDVPEEQERQEQNRIQQELLTGVASMQDQLRRLELNMAVINSRRSPPRFGSWDHAEKDRGRAGGATTPPSFLSPFSAAANRLSPPVSRPASLTRGDAAVMADSVVTNNVLAQTSRVDLSELFERLSRQEEAVGDIKQQLAVQHQMLANLVRHFTQTHPSAAVAAALPSGTATPLPQSNSRTRHPGQEGDSDPLLRLPPS